MAIVFSCGCDILSTAMLPRYFTATSGVAIDATGGRGGGPALRNATYATGSVTVAVPQQTTYTMRRLFKRDGTFQSTEPDSNPVITTYGSSTRGGIRLSISGNGDLYVHRNTYNGTSSTTWTQCGFASTSIGIGTLNEIVMRAKVTVADAIVQVWLNGGLIIDYTGAGVAHSGNEGIVSAVFGIPYISGTTTFSYLDDIYIADENDNTGGYLGDGRMFSLFANADSADANHKQWTPSTGTDHYAVVDETTVSETDYLSATAANQIETLGFQNLAGSGAIRFVALSADLQKSDAANCSAALVARPGSTDDVGPDIALPTGFKIYQRGWKVNPDTGSAWTASEINAAEFGVKRTV